MPNPQNPAPSLLSQNLRSARGVCGTPSGWKTPVRETPSERAARKASETKDAERRAARAAKVAIKHRKEAEVVGAKNNKRKKKQTRANESNKKKATQVHYSSSDPVKIESADDDSCFEPTDGTGDDDNDDDEGGKTNSFASAYSHDSDIENNQLASPEERRRGARGTAE
jgi:hypothetical protein